jgi:hypothetical protein
MLRLAKRGLVASTALILALALTEIVFRVSTDAPRYHDSDLRLDAELGFRQAPNLDLSTRDDLGPFRFRTNSLGLRGPELPLEQHESSGTTRVVFVGDSFLHAFAVRDESLMTEVMRSHVSEATGRAPEVYNLSCPDYGTAQELLLFRRLGAPLEPDAVVLALYTGNDVANNGFELAGEWKPTSGDYLRPYLVPDGDGFELRHAFPLRAFLRRHSRTFAVAERAILARAVAQDIRWLQPWAEPLESTESRLARGLAPTLRLELLRPHAPGDSEFASWEDAWRTTEALLRAFRDECRALGARLLVLVIPMRDQVLAEALTADFDLRSQLATQRSIHELLDWNLPERRLAPFFERAGIDARFLLDPLRAAPTDGERVYVMDGHLALHGHAIAGGVVADWFLGRPSSAAVVESTSPTPGLPPPAIASPWIDFRSAPREAHLAFGFFEWQQRFGDSGLGWVAGQHSTVVLPARAGELVVRGWLPEQASLPVRLSVNVQPLATRTFVLDSHGPFELSWPNPIPAALLERLGARYFAVSMHVDRLFSHFNSPRAGFLLQEIGLR